MITKEQIANWMTAYEGGDNWEYVQRVPDYFSSAGLKRKLIEAKMLVDRWDNISTDIIIHTSHKDPVRNELGNDIVGNNSVVLVRDVVAKLSLEAQKAFQRMFDEAADHLWGADIHYSDNISPNQGIMMARNPDGSLQDIEFPGRCIAVFPM